MVQPKRSNKKVDEDRTFDTTQLRAAGYQYQVHRDYAAHYFRWGFGSRYVNTKMKVLDVGCGQDLPFAKSLGGSNPNSVPKLYVGCDLNKIPKLPNRKNFHFLPEFNFIKDHKKILNEHGKFDIAVNFEVIEHMTKPMGRKLLKAFYDCLEDDGILILSTPVFDGKAAANHIHEYEIDELRTMFTKAGFVEEERFGTFANYHKIKKAMTKEERKIYERVREYYSDDVAACFFAPCYPDHSRNNVWIMRKVL